MLRRDYFAHGSFLSRMLSFNARGPVVGENLAWGAGSFASPATVIREWLQSPEHRRNLLRPGYRATELSYEGWTDAGVRVRVGAHHVPLDDLVNAVLEAGLTLERFLESEGEPPGLLAFRARR